MSEEFPKNKQEDIPEVTPSKDGYLDELLDKVYSANPQAKIEKDRMVKFLHDSSFHIETLRKSIDRWNERQTRGDGPSGIIEEISTPNGTFVVNHQPSNNSIYFNITQ